MPAVLALLALLLLAPSASAASSHTLTGAWRSAPEETPLSSEFDESVWGKNAKSVRTVDLTVKPTGDAALTVTRKILDAHGREIKSATSIEHADLTIGAAQPSNDVRSDLAVTVTHAERQKLESHVALLRTSGLDRDMLDEQARRVLGLVGDKEIVVFERAGKPPS